MSDEVEKIRIHMIADGLGMRPAEVKAIELLVRAVVSEEIQMRLDGNFTADELEAIAWWVRNTNKSE